jgi:prolyl oligopeptidase
VRLFDLSGAPAGLVELPTIGSLTGIEGEPSDTEMFLGFTSFVQPSTNYRYDFITRRLERFGTSALHINPADYETTQAWYPSKDGTQISMFLVHRKGLERDGNRPVLLSGYGGFNISLTPAFDPANFVLLDAGGIFALANLRGGGEYGEEWHRQGMKLKKQNVFDDFIAAAEWLIANKYTSSERLAIQGGSNGGLLIGAVINQRPELFKVAIPQVGVMDMLRFHKFTIGWNWIADYGSSDTPEEFKALYAYSPLHNIKAGAKYPATLITTADHDDRVVPAHSFKYAATLQEKASKETPILIRIETKSGHGASSQTKAIETTADIYSFIMFNMGLTPSPTRTSAPAGGGAR